MNNRDIYKDEFGQYHEVEEEQEETLDGPEDDEQDYYEEDAEESDDFFDSAEDEDSDYYDEDEEYANGSGNDYDVDED
ncbi:hypothetical protein DOM21_07085 [Bacteriovorax stolpii]|uniref:hypothetical protein n=1 Tax=Bacteriovorax stolpii TaxID=960 RepID=UPI00115A8906|nr:hypothetical protein [Bacteriovorax stolpii]QDK41223.1 hypothetical protein DOM21_07085 [Bacteriovorax stolpii]